MKNSKKLLSNALSRADLKKIKGGLTAPCSTAWVTCHPNCGHFTTSYSTYITCIDSYHITGCSPLQGWGVVCGNYN
ncbi:MAG: hypothetical protein JWR09_4532 [Mucilaginibacter sp.]|nr:hypothetical protein [Mucilaginibacter sp.]